MRAGKLVAFGTETVYGLGADATNPQAVASIFEAKGRPRFNPLICHYPSAASAFRHVIADERAQLLGRRFWPGPLTLVLPRQPDCPVALLTGAGLDTLAVRVPGHVVALSLLRGVGRPIAAPSANRSGQVSPTSARHVLDGLAGRIDAVLDSGPCKVGVEFTVLDLSGPDPVLLRPGGVTIDDLEASIGPILRRMPQAAGEALRSPGLMASHYAPTLPVRLDATSVADDEALLGVRTAIARWAMPVPAQRVRQVRRKPRRVCSRGCAGSMRTGCGAGAKRIAVMPVPESGLGAAINDRLRRAAAPRNG